MKTVLIFILALPFFCFAQKKQDVTAKAGTTVVECGPCPGMLPIPPTYEKINFSPYERSKVEEHDNLVKQFNAIVKNFKAIDSTYWKFITDELTINKVDLSRLSQHSDSLKIKEEGIFYILKSKKNETPAPKNQLNHDIFSISK